jgi:hypothetical protein
MKETHLSPHGPEFFHTGHAIGKLRSGAAVSEVFPGLTKGTITRKSLYELVARYSRPDSKKYAINTLKTAFLFDTLQTIESFPIRTFPQDEIVHSFHEPIQYDDRHNRPEELESAQSLSIIDLERAIRVTALNTPHQQTTQPIIDALLPYFEASLRQDPSNIYKELMKRVEFNINTLRERIPTYEHTLLQVYANQIQSIDQNANPNSCSYQTYLELFRNSQGLLLKPAGSDDEYALTFDLMFDTGNKTPDDYRTQFKLRKKENGQLHVVHNAELSRTLHDLYASETYQNQKITGCPAAVSQRTNDKTEPGIISTVVERIAKHIEAQLR